MDNVIVQINELCLFSSQHFICIQCVVNSIKHKYLSDKVNNLVRTVLNSENLMNEDGKRV